MALQTAVETPRITSTTRKDDCWIAGFLELEQNSFFCRISDSYLADNFELHELDSMVLNYKLALNLLRNRKKEEYKHLPTEQQQAIKRNAVILYGLIHARFIITKKGLKKMRQKYICKDFGVCLRNNCNQQPLLPTGITDETTQEFVRLYCSNCNEIYLPKKQYHKKIDGAYFGTTFAHLFLLLFPTFKPRQVSIKQAYTPKIFGFKLHKTWHKIALKEWNQKYHPNTMNDNDNDNNELEENNVDIDADAERQINYLIQLKQKHQDEIIRLGNIIQKQQTEIRKINSLNKKQSIQILSLQTKVNTCEQQAISKQNSLIAAHVHVDNAAPLPISISNNDDKKEWEQELGFKDILEQLNQRISILKNKCDKSKTHAMNRNFLEIYENQLDEICKVSDSFKFDVNQFANGI